MNTRNHGLDFLRFVACLGIVFLHFSNYGCSDGVYFGNVLIDPDGDLYNFSVIVVIFFGLSGFLAYSRRKKIEDGEGFGRYLSERMIRIIPMLAISVVCWVLTSDWLIRSKNAAAVPGHDLWALIEACLGVEYGWVFEAGGIQPESWFVGVLLLCFVLFYFCVWLAKQKKMNPVWFFGLFVLFGALCYSQEFELPFCGVRSGTGYEAFFFGAILADFIERKKVSGKIYIASGLIVLCYFIYLIFWPQYVVFGKVHLISFLVAPASIILLSSPGASRLFAWKGWQFLGKITYSAYLLHVSVLFALFSLMNMAGVRIDYAHEVVLITFELIVFSVGALAYLLLERPITRYLKKRFEQGA